MIDSYRKKIEELIHSLQSTPGISVSKAVIADPASPQAIDVAMGYSASRLPEGVKEFYEQLNGLQLEWKFTGEISAGQEPDAGSIQLLPIERIFGNWKKTIWFDGAEQYRPVKPFDLFQPEACMAFHQNPDETPGDTVWFHYLGESLSETGYTFPDYINLLAESRGYLYWQTSLLDGTAGNPETKRFFERMPILFPAFEPGKFLPKKK